MKFIREMIARKAAGDEDRNQGFGVEALDPAGTRTEGGDGHAEAANAIAGFEDELDAPEAPGAAGEAAAEQAVFDRLDVEEHANDDAEAGGFEPVIDDDYDEEAELDALDAAFPDLEPDAAGEGDEPVAAFPRATPVETAASAEAMFADIPDPDTDEPMPELTAADIERAMKNRRKIWHDMPGDDDPLAIPEGVSDAITRPIRPITQELTRAPVSVPLELVNPSVLRLSDTGPAPEPAPQANLGPAPAPTPEPTSAPAPEPTPEATAEPAPEATAAPVAEGPAPDPLALEEDPKPSAASAFYDEPAPVAPEPVMDRMADEQGADFPDEMAAHGNAEAEEEAAAGLAPVFEEDLQEEDGDWPAPAEPYAAEQPAQAPAEDAAADLAAQFRHEPAPEAEPEPDPEPMPMQQEVTDIQAMMARAALDAAAERPVARGPQPAGGDPDELPRPQRRAGRIKTRLLGFQAEGPGRDIFDGAEAAPPAQPDMFPVGWIVVVEGPGRGASFALHNGVSLIGRGEDQAVCLDFGDNSISRNNHASIAYDDEGNQFYLGHGGKSNIVRLNRKPVLSTEELGDGDLIRLGETTLRFKSFCGAEFSWSENSGDEAGNAASG